MNKYSEKFEKMRIAGKLAAQTLDMLTGNIKEGVSTDTIDKLGYEFIKDNLRLCLYKQWYCSNSR